MIELEGFLLGSRLGVRDGLGQAFLLLTSALWLAAGWSLRSYFASDPRRASFLGFFAASMLGNVGLVLAQDVVSFYLFFSMLSFASYGMIVHRRTPEARRAASVYIGFTIAGEALLLTGLLLVLRDEPNLLLEQARKQLAQSPDRQLIAALLFAGFGIKAGVAPLHVWLPLAHPVAPTPASAVLSGALIKAGLLGWLQLLPLGLVALPSLGTACGVLGIGAALAAALFGVMQSEPKTILAYSSISQMGMMTVALGAILVQPELAPAGIAAIATFALYHALAKGTLFLGTAVAVPERARTRRAVALAVLAVAALSIAGAPATGGALAKRALHDVLAGAEAPWKAFSTALSVAAVGSTLLMLRFLSVVAPQLGRRREGPAIGVMPMVLLMSISLAAVGHALMDGAQHGALALQAIFSAAWPMLTGVLLYLALRRPITRAWRQFDSPVPPGDLIVALEWTARRAQSIPAAAAARADRLVQNARAARRATYSSAARWVDAVDRLELRLARYAVVGSGFALLIALLLVLTLG